MSTCLTVMAMLFALSACGGGSENSAPASGDKPSGDGGTPAATAPTITTQPTAQAVTAPAVAAFSVAASGTAPLTYQWRNSANGTDWTPIAAATAASYQTGATAVNMSGSYYSVIVSNSAGSVTSAAVQLTVVAPPSGGTFLTPLAGPADPLPYTPAPLSVTPVAGSRSDRGVISWEPLSSGVVSMTLGLSNDAQARLQVPVDAFIDEVPITVTEVTNLAPVGSASAPLTAVLAAVSVEPGDLVTERKGIKVAFTLPGTLTGGVALDDLVGFVADSDGSNLHLVPIFAGPANVPVIQVDHLGIFGIAVASAAQRSALAAAWPADPRDQIAAALAPAMTAAWVNTVRPAAASARIKPAEVRALDAEPANPLLAPLQGYFNNSVVPAFAAAYGDSAQIPAAIQTGFMFLRNAELTGLSASGGPLQPIADDLQARISTLADRYADYVASQCASVGGPPQLQAMLGWMRTLQLLGHQAKSDELEASLSQCSQFTVTFHHEYTNEWHTLPDQIDSDYKLSTVVDGTTTIGLNAPITLSPMRLTSVELQTTSNQGTLHTHSTATPDPDTSPWAAWDLSIPVLRTKQGPRSSSLSMTLHAYGVTPLYMTLTTKGDSGDTRVEPHAVVPLSLSVPALPYAGADNYGPILIPPSGSVTSNADLYPQLSYHDISHEIHHRVTVTLKPAR
ncbi:MAG TPA: hypothetical protein VGM81_03105 [Burkholderiaceae bacterium]